jgi:hypothetical protein
MLRGYNSPKLSNRVARNKEVSHDDLRVFQHGKFGEAETVKSSPLFHGFLSCLALCRVSHSGPCRESEDDSLGRLDAHSICQGVIWLDGGEADDTKREPRGLSLSLGTIRRAWGHFPQYFQGRWAGIRPSGYQSCAMHLRQRGNKSRWPQRIVSSLGCHGL